MPDETGNNRGCLTPEKFFFVSDTSIECPDGTMKLAYKDQDRLYRVVSLDSRKKSRRSIKNSSILENCIRAPKRKQLPNSMSPTYSSAAKITAKKVRTNIQTSTSRPQPISNRIDSLMTRDHSEIMSSHYSDFETADSFCSLEDTEYLNNTFPRNMFDYKGDAIYGTGLIISLLSFIVTLIKLILEKKKSTPTYTKFERPNQPVTSSFNIPDVSNRNNIQSHFFNDPSAPVYYVPQITTLESDLPSQPIRLQQPSLSAIETNNLPSTSQRVISLQTLQKESSLSRQQTRSQQPAIIEINTTNLPTQNQRRVSVQPSPMPHLTSVVQKNGVQLTALNDFCLCRKGNCTSEACHCNMAKRA